MRRALPFAIAAMAAGCHGDAPAAIGGFTVPLEAEAAPGDEVVARVDGRAIYASEVASQAKAARVSAREALDELISAEVLAGEAARHGYGRDREALEKARADATLRLLQRTFEAQVTAKSVPDKLVRRAYHGQINLYDHSTLADVWHILVPAVPGDPPAYHAKARALADQIARRAHGVKDAEAFQQLASVIALPEGLRPLKVERVASAKDGWLDPQFTVPVFEQLHNPGDVSTVIHTDKFGYHVAYLLRYIPALHRSVADVTPELQQAIFPSWQRGEFLRFVREIGGTHEVAVFPERLGAPVAEAAKK